MRNITAVNRWIGIAGLVLCFSLAALALPGWWYLRHHELSSDAIVRTRVLRPGLMVYVIRRNGDAASAPYLYDYYLSGRFVDRSALGNLMDRRAPFLTADNDMADIVADGDDAICVALIGHVFGFENSVVLNIHGVRRSIAIGMAARPAEELADATTGATRAVPRPVPAGPNGQPAGQHGDGGSSVCRMLP